LFLTLGRCVPHAASRSLCGSVAVAPSPVATQPRVVAQADDVDALIQLGNKETKGTGRYSKFYLLLKALATVKAGAGAAFYAPGWSVPVTYVGKTYQTLKDRLAGHKSDGQLTYLLQALLKRVGRTLDVRRYVHSPVSTDRRRPPRRSQRASTSPAAAMVGECVGRVAHAGLC
jgi:hypothetical protein